MKTVDPKDRLEGDWEPSQIPDLRPDLPAVEPPKLRVLPPEAPSLCAQGPCIHYHEVAYEMDAQRPLDHSEASSKSHRMRTCYPSSGIEMPLDAPVFDCNLWQPHPPRMEDQREAVRLRYMASDAGKAYVAELEVWKLDQERIRKEEADIASIDIVALGVIGELLVDMDAEDKLEVRVRGRLDIVAHISAPPPDLDHDGLAALGQQWTDTLCSSFGPGEYQIRHIRPNGVIKAIKHLAIEPTHEPSQENPE